MDKQDKELPGVLSPRQRQILELVAQRQSSKEIAKSLGLSPATVDSHVATILTKLGVGTRREAVDWLLGSSEKPLWETRQHGDVPLVSRPPWSQRFLKVKQSNGNGLTTSLATRTTHPGMGQALLRFVLDAIYVVLFFAILSAAAYGVDEIVHFCEARRVDEVVIYILKAISYVLVAIDGIGVASATGILSYRFICAILRTGNENGQ